MEKNYQKRFKQLGYEPVAINNLGKRFDKKNSLKGDMVLVTDRNVILRLNGKLVVMSLDLHLAIRDLVRDI